MRGHGATNPVPGGRDRLVASCRSLGHSLIQYRRSAGTAAHYFGSGIGFPVRSTNVTLVNAANWSFTLV
jgi:hypothetical protein